MGAVAWSLPTLLGLVLPLWEGGPPAGASTALVVAGLLVKAHQVHARRPGAWFPLLVTGSVLFALASTHPVDRAAFELWRYLVGLAVAIGLGFWAWRARSGTVAVTAVGYLAAVLCFQPVAVEPVFRFLTAAQLRTLPPALGSEPYPELVVVAGAVLAYARLDRVRPWHVLVIAGLLGSLWHYSAFALLAAGVVVAAHGFNARRPGAWYPLLLVGVGLVAWPVIEMATAPPWVDTGFGPSSDGMQVSISFASSDLVATSYVDYDEVFFACVVAVGLVVWAWRRRSPVVLLTGLGYPVAAYLDSWSPDGLVVLAGAAVALATTTAPGGVRTAGRSAGTPGRWRAP